MIEQARLFSLHAPANARITGNGSTVNVFPGHDFLIVAEISKGDAAANLTLTPQRDDAAGTGFEALAANMNIWEAVDTATSEVLVRDTDALLYTCAAAADDHRVVMRINPDSLGLLAGGTRATRIRVVVAGGHADDRGTITAYLVPTRYKP